MYMYTFSVRIGDACLSAGRGLHSCIGVADACIPYGAGVQSASQHEGQFVAGQSVGLLPICDVAPPLLVVVYAHNPMPLRRLNHPPVVCYLGMSPDIPWVVDRYGMGSDSRGNHISIASSERLGQSVSTVDGGVSTTLLPLKYRPHAFAERD